MINHIILRSKESFIYMIKKFKAYCLYKMRNGGIQEKCTSSDRYNLRKKESFSKIYKKRILSVSIVEVKDYQ